MGPRPRRRRFLKRWDIPIFRTGASADWYTRSDDRAITTGRRPLDRGRHRRRAGRGRLDLAAGPRADRRTPHRQLDPPSRRRRLRHPRGHRTLPRRHAHRLRGTPGERTANPVDPRAGRQDGADAGGDGRRRHSLLVARRQTVRNEVSRPAAENRNVPSFYSAGNNAARRSWTRFCQTAQPGPSWVSLLIGV